MGTPRCNWAGDAGVDVAKVSGCGVLDLVEPSLEVPPTSPLSLVEYGTNLASVTSPLPGASVSSSARCS